MLILAVEPDGLHGNSRVTILRARTKVWELSTAKTSILEQYTYRVLKLLTRCCTSSIECYRFTYRGNRKRTMVGARASSTDCFHMLKFDPNFLAREICFAYGQNYMYYV